MVPVTLLLSFAAAVAARAYTAAVRAVADADAGPLGRANTRSGVRLARGRPMGARGEPTSHGIAFPSARVTKSIPHNPNAEALRHAGMHPDQIAARRIAADRAEESTLAQRAAAEANAAAATAAAVASAAAAAEAAAAANATLTLAHAPNPAPSAAPVPPAPAPSLPSAVPASAADAPTPLHTDQLPHRTEPTDQTSSRLAITDLPLSRLEITDLPRTRTELTDQTPSRPAITDLPPSRLEITDMPPSRLEITDLPHTRTELTDQTPSRPVIITDLPPSRLEITDLNASTTDSSLRPSNTQPPAPPSSSTRPPPTAPDAPFANKKTHAQRKITRPIHENNYNQFRDGLPLNDAAARAQHLSQCGYLGTAWLHAPCYVAKEHLDTPMLRLHINAFLRLPVADVAAITCVCAKPLCAQSGVSHLQQCARIEKTVRSNCWGAYWVTVWKQLPGHIHIQHEVPIYTTGERNPMDDVVSGIAAPPPAHKPFAFDRTIVSACKARALGAAAATPGYQAEQAHREKLQQHVPHIDANTYNFMPIAAECEGHLHESVIEQLRKWADLAATAQLGGAEPATAQEQRRHKRSAAQIQEGWRRWLSVGLVVACATHIRTGIRKSIHAAGQEPTTHTGRWSRDIARLAVSTSARRMWGLAGGSGGGSGRGVMRRAV